MYTIARPAIMPSFRRLAASSAVSARYQSTRLVFSSKCDRRSDLMAGRHYTSSMHENDPEVLEREKARNLGGKNKDFVHKHAPGWNEVLASASEANVKADKAEGNPETLQSTTVEFLRTKRRETDGEESTTAHYSRDEVTGPLRNAKEKVIVSHGTVIEDDLGPNVVAKAIKEARIRTMSELDVKADREEL